MDLLSHLEKTNRKQFLEQANYVYIGAVLSSTFFLPLMYFTGNMLAFVFTIISVLISLGCFLLNRKGYYSLASALFIANITFQAVSNSLFFGTKTGFVFYIFNMSVLIVYTKWKGIYKLLGIILEALILIGVSIYSVYVPIITPLATPLLITFFVINVILNLAGVTNSPNFYLGIARQAQADLRLYAITDYLTQLPNRTALNNFIKGMKTRKDRPNRSFGVMMIDIDHFKEINDKYGHPVGDEVLVQISEVFRTLVGPYDFLGRHGGEEFIIVHFDESEEYMLVFAEHVRKSIEETFIRVGERQLSVTISIGLLYRTTQEISYEECIAAADSLLYLAKDAGRNRVISKTI